MRARTVQFHTFQYVTLPHLLTAEISAEGLSLAGETRGSLGR